MANQHIMLKADDIRYDPDRAYLLLQLPPNSWDENRFAQFDQIIQFLLHRNCTFILPYAYHQLS